MRTRKRRTLKKTLLSKIIIYVAIIIVIITQISIKLAADNIESLTESILARESATYANEIYSWWNAIRERVGQTADVMRNIPELSYDDALAMLLKLTELDQDSQDIYLAYGNTGKFLDGSGWIPDDTFVFTDRPWYTGAIDKKGEIYSSEPYVDASTGKTCLACSVMLWDGVALSSDINFDMVLEKLMNFKSISPDARYYIISKDTRDILLSNIVENAGTNLSSSTDPVLAGISTVFDSLNKSGAADGEKVVTVKTDAGSQMVAAIDIEGTSGQLAQNARSIMDLCSETLDASAKGKEEMAGMTKNVRTLNDTINELTSLIRETAKTVEEITGITDTINAISSQTNLLSLNASIEAARAGEMGKGFAVVATEVGTLAGRSSEATETIRRLVDWITKNISDINSKAEICGEDMEACLGAVSGANESFEIIYDDVARATEGIGEIAEGIDRINGVASNNAATTEEQAANIAQVLDLSNMIVSESTKLRAETENITSISENLNQYSDEINTDLSQYTV